jgi:exosortase/archaeosortase family protein
MAEPPRATGAARPAPLAPLAWGLAWFAGLYGVYAHWPGVADAFIELLTVKPAAALLQWLAPDLQAQALGSRLLVDGGALNVRHGCEGADLALLAASAALAVPAPWRWRLAGLLLMLAAAFGLNQLRLLTLLLAHLRQPAWFDALHTLWLPLAMVLLLATLLFAWTARCPRPGAGG